MITRLLVACVLAGVVVLGTSAAIAGPAPVAPVASAPGSPLTTIAHGRISRSVGPDGAVTYRSQWPGAYFETAFRGTEAFFRVGGGKVRLRVTVDAVTATLTATGPGAYRIGPLAGGAHRLRVDIVSENQASPVDFGGFSAPPASRLPAAARRARQIEFIGDSHTVGYGDASDGRVCTPEEAWVRTDTADGLAGRLAARYGADYQVNAISGRGVVRNYAGMAADTLPQAYPFVLFDKRTRYRDAAWRPEVIVLALGTNDFSTPLHAGERWVSEAALRADYRRAYADFLRGLRRRNPGALIAVWAVAGSETAAQSAKVVRAMRTGGERRIGLVPVAGVTLRGCDFHPNLADDQLIADRLAAVIDSRTGIWGGAEPVRPAGQAR